MDIIIGFPNDERIYTISEYVSLKYPNSIFSLYFASETSEPIILQDMNYESFGQIFDVIHDMRDQWTLDNDILNWMDKYGLVNDSLYLTQRYMNEKFNTKMLSIKKFIDGETKAIIPNSFEKYREYKQIFSNHKNIIPVQVTVDGNEIICVHIYECIPIYYFNQLDIYLNRNISTIDNLKFGNVIDVNMMKYNIIVKNIGCEICIECDEHAAIYGKPCKGCPDCVLCVNSYPRNPKSHLNIYDNDFTTYFTSIHNLIFEERGDNKHYLRFPCDTPRMMDLTNIVPPEFISDMPTYFKKINNIIPNTFENVLKKYFALSCDDGLHHSNIKTYSLFVNIY